MTRRQHPSANRRHILSTAKCGWLAVGTRTRVWVVQHAREHDHGGGHHGKEGEADGGVQGAGGEGHAEGGGGLLVGCWVGGKEG